MLVSWIIHHLCGANQVLKGVKQELWSSLFIASISMLIHYTKISDNLRAVYQDGDKMAVLSRLSSDSTNGNAAWCQSCLHDMFNVYPCFIINTLCFVYCVIVFQSSMCIHVVFIHLTPPFLLDVLCRQCLTQAHIFQTWSQMSKKITQPTLRHPDLSHPYVWTSAGLHVWATTWHHLPHVCNKFFWNPLYEP